MRPVLQSTLVLILALMAVAELSCSAGRSGSGLSSGSESDVIRSFSAGSSPVSYTATVYAPRSSGRAIVAPAIGSQTAFQYFNQAIASAIGERAASLTFPQGNYTITPEGGVSYHILVGSATDLTIDWQGSTLTFAGAQASGGVEGIVTVANRRVLLKNLTIDYDVRIASGGTIQSEAAHCAGVTRKYILINTAQYPMADSRIQQAKIINDSSTTLWGKRANEFYTYASPIPLQGGNAFYPCSAAFDTAFPSTGMTVTVRHFAYDGNAIAIYGPGTEDITLRSITIYSGPAMGIYGSGIRRGIALDRVRVIKNPNDAGRLVTLAADGAHFDQTGGDIVIENSEFSFQGDDGLNISSHMLNGTVVSGNQVIISNANAAVLGSAVSLGDTFAFYSPTFSELGTATLLSGSQSASTTLAFNSLAGIPSGSWLVDKSLNASAVYIADNSFHDNRERAIMLRSKGVMIANNTFTSNSGPAILLATDGVYFKEGGIPQDITIQRNVIAAANTTQTSTGTLVAEYGAISLGVQCPSASGCTNNLSPNSLIQNVDISSNVISTTAGLGILISNSTGVAVRGNNVTDTTSTVLQSAFGGAGSAAGSVHSTRSSGLNVQGNTLSRSATSN